MATNDIVTGGNLGPEFEIGTGPDATKITVKVDGVTVLRNATTGELSSPAAVETLTAIGYNNGTNVLTYTDENGNDTNMDLSALAADIFVNGASFDAGSTTLTLTDNDGTTPDVTVDLSGLVGVSTDVGNLLTAGVDNKAFLDCAAIKTSCTSVCNDVFGTPLFNAFTP